eukprot:TRINITY_DN13914_c2_g1_i1.p1 TRINITY_DN13914_c2_g1~~TRINITY_DN13914_c2_g1_i1.p1  ORF type:complete len:293 (+),score=77.21 TRINITY_DN13914_c2_g1_i1:255-1133(+)
MVSYVIEVEEQPIAVPVSRSPSAKGGRFASPVVHSENIYLRSLKDDNTRLKDDTKRLENEVEKLKAEIASMKTKQPEQKKDIKNDMLREQEEELMRMEKEVSYLKRALDDALGRSSQGDARVSALKAEVVKRTEESAGRQELLMENKNLQRMLEAGKAQVREYQNESEKWKEEVKSYMEQKEQEYNNEISRLNNEFALYTLKTRDYTEGLLVSLRAAEQRASLAEGEANARRVLSSPSSRQHTSPTRSRSQVVLKDDLSLAVEKLKADVTSLHTRPSLHTAQEALTSYRGLL